MKFLQLLKVFILSSIFNSEDEYNPKSSKFNPTKTIVTMVLFGSFIFNFYTIYRITVVYKQVEKECPSVATELEND